MNTTNKRTKTLESRGTEANEALKWFYPIQEKIQREIRSNNYEPFGYCIFQDVTEKRYYESWNVVDVKRQKVINLLFVGIRSNGHLITYKAK